MPFHAANGPDLVGNASHGQTIGQGFGFDCRTRCISPEFPQSGSFACARVGQGLISAIGQIARVFIVELASRRDEKLTGGKGALTRGTRILQNMHAEINGFFTPSHASRWT